MFGSAASRWALASTMKPARRGKPLRRDRMLAIAAALSLFACFLFARSLQSSLPASRRCRVSWPTLLEKGARPRVAIVALSDVGKNVSKDLWDPKGRSFEGVLEATRQNKEDYAKRHGYRYFDASFLLDTSRPPAWSKILAVQNYLADNDWVMWMDSDSLITNPDIRLESILPAGDGPDLIVTKDLGGYNAGMWFVRNCAWSRKFLTTWWSMSSYIRKAGDTKSGDNDAMKRLLGHMSAAEHAEHVGLAPQCTFNSYLFRASFRNWVRHAMDPDEFERGLHHDGDFLLHLAGVENKMVHIRKFLLKQPINSQ